MSYTEDDLLPISALQHLRAAVCLDSYRAGMEGEWRIRSLPPAGRRRCFMQSGAKVVR
jgi:hypothetical protein